METVLQDVPVLFVESPNGPAGSGEAFQRLESRLSSLKGRKFYATYQYATGQYRACVALEATDDVAQIGLDIWTIPGGRYAQRKLDDWTDHADEIPRIFETLSHEYSGRIDSSRPSIEFYKSEKELRLLLPII